MIDEGLQRVKDAAARKIEATDESREPNPWLRRTGWARHLAGLDRERLRALVRPADGEDEAELSVIHRALRQLIRKAQQVAVTEVVGQPALFEAHRKERAAKPSKPFNSRMDKTTFRTYTGHWVQLLSFVFRVEEEGLEPGERPGYRLSSGQRLAYDGMIEAAEAVVDGQVGTGRHEQEGADGSRGQDEQEKAEEEVER